jgi:rare lipoprotein A
MKNCLLIILAFLFCVNILFAQDSALIKYTDTGKIVCGKASFYSRSLDGSRTAIGTKFRHNKMTGASNFFKLRTWVRVTRVATGKSIIVYINDHMPAATAKKGRVIDLSRIAAGKLGFLHLGLTKVRVEEVLRGTKE